MDLLSYNIVEQPNDDHGLDQTTDDDDDVFYAELERRILLLINTADENDDLMAATSYNNSKIRKSYLDDYSLSQSYFDWTDSDQGQGSSSYSVPSRILNLWRSNVNGTGVFIPHTLKSKRKNKPRRKKNDDTTAVYKEVGNKSRLSKDVVHHSQS